MISLAKIRSLLEESIACCDLKIKDESFRHKRHKEAKNHGGGHFSIFIVAESFIGQPKIQRHRIIYKALNMPRPEIHALSIIAKTPQELEKNV